MEYFHQEGKRFRSYRISFEFSESCRVLKGGLNIVGREGWIVFEYIWNALSGSDKLYDKINWNSRPFNTRFSVQGIGIGYNPRKYSIAYGCGESMCFHN